MALVKGLGADRVIDYTAEDFTEEEQTYDVVFDAVGKSSFGRCKRLLKPHGIYLSTELGPLPQNPILALITPLLRRQEGPVSDSEARPGDGAVHQGTDRVREVQAGHRRTYPLDQIVEAYRYVETGQKIGNVVISLE